MSRMFQGLSPIPLREDKPSNRGRFSDERQYWEQLHQSRYTKWQLGGSAEDIAAEEGVTSNAIRHSIAWCEGRLPNAQVVEGRKTRLRLRTFAQLSERYVEELDKLMSDPNPIIRTRALEAFRRTVGLETGNGVHVNVNQQTAILQSERPRSFEEALVAVRRNHIDRESTEDVAMQVASSGSNETDRF